MIQMISQVKYVNQTMIQLFTFVFFLIITLLVGPIGFEILSNWTFYLLLVTNYSFNGLAAISSKDSFCGYLLFPRLVT